MAHTRNYSAMLIAVVLAALPLVYVVSYFALVQPIREVVLGPMGAVVISRPYYRGVHSDWTATFYGPVHAADRLARRDVWSTKDPK